MAAALIPIAGGLIGSLLNKKIDEKLNQWDLKQKSKDFFEKKYKATAAYKQYEKVKDKTIQTKIDSLEKQIKTQIEKLRVIKETNNLQEISKQLTVIQKLEDQRDSLKETRDEKIAQEEKAKKEIEKKLQSVFKVEKPDPVIQVDDSNITIEKTADLKLQPLSDTQVQQKEVAQKRIRNTTKPQGRPTGSKDKVKRKGRQYGDEPQSSSSILTEGPAAEFATSSKGFGVSGTLLPNSLDPVNVEQAVTGASPTDKKLLKLTNLLFVTSKEQLEQLEEMNKAIKNLDTGGGIVSDVLKAGGAAAGAKQAAKTIAKTALKHAPAVTKAVGKLAGPAAAAIEAGMAAYQYNEESKDLEARYKKGEISKEEMEQGKHQSAYRNTGKAGGAIAGMAGGAAAGAAIGSIIPGPGTAIGGIIGGAYGAWKGGQLGGQLGDKLGAPPPAKTQQDKELFDYLKTTAYLESGFDPNAKAGTSSATGMYQFIDKTWEETAKKQGVNFTKEDRKDPVKAAQMAAAFAMDNKKTIEKGTGQKASGTDMYMGHFLGGQGAVNFLNAKNKNGDQIAANDPNFKAAAKANPSIFYKPDGSARSYNEVYGIMDNKYQKGKAIADKAIGNLGDKKVEAEQPTPPPTQDQQMLMKPEQPKMAEVKEIKTPKIETPITTTVTNFDNNKEEAKKIREDMQRKAWEVRGIKFPEQAKQNSQVVTNNNTTSSSSSSGRPQDEISAALMFTLNNT